MIVGLAGAIGAMRAIAKEFPAATKIIAPCAQACEEAINLLKEQDDEIKRQNQRIWDLSTENEMLKEKVKEIDPD